MNNPALILLFITSAILNLGLAIYGWRHRQIPGALAFSLAMLLFAFLPLAQAVNLTSSDLTIKVIALKSRVEMAGIGAIAWLVMVMQFTGYAQLINRRFLMLLSSVMLVILVLNWTENPLFRSGYYVERLGDASVLHWTNGPVLWFGLIYLNALLLTPLYLLWRSYGRLSPLSFQQTFALGVSTVLPLLVNILSQAGFPPVQGINFPFAAGPVMGLIVALAILRYHIFDVIPIARGLLIENMSDGILVLDTQNRIVDINPAMQELIGSAGLGQKAETVLAAWPDLVERFHDTSEVRTEIVVDGNPPAHFDLSISPISEKQGALRGRLIIVRDITKHKQTEAALRASENNLRQMLESTPDAMVIVDQAGEITVANNQCEKVFGYSQPELIGRPVEDLLLDGLREIHKTHRASYYRNPQVRSMGASSNWELMALRKDKTMFPVEISLSPLKAEAGPLTIASIRNVTERKQIEAQLRLHAAALEAAANAIVITDRQDVIQWVNPAFTRLTGYTASEAVGQTTELFRSAQHDKSFYTEIEKTIHVGLIWEGEVINQRKDGFEYVEEQTITPVQDQGGQPSHFIAIKQDITARRKAEIALREAELKYRTLVEQLPAVLYMDAPDERGTGSYISPQVEALLGYPHSDWEADPFFWFKCLHPEDFDRAVGIINNTLMEGHATEEYRMIGRDGKIVWVRDHSRLVRDASGQPQFVQGFLEDVTDRKHAEELIRRQNNYLIALHQITLDLFNRRKVDEVLQGIIQRATEYLDAPFCEIMLAEGSELVVRAFTSNQPFLAGDRIQRGDARLSWQAFDTKSAALINDYSDWEFRRDVYRGLDLGAVVALPILAGDECIGVLDLSRPKSGRVFDNSEIQAATMFAQLAALVLENTRLSTAAENELLERTRAEETLRSQNDYLAALHEVTLGLINRLDLDSLLEAMLTHVVALMKTRHGYIELLDPAQDVLVQKVAIGNYAPQNGFRITRGMGLSGRVWESGEMLIIPNYNAWEGALPEFDWLRTTAGIPLKIEGRVIGVIGVAFDDIEHAFTREEIDLLQRFANLASVALDNAQLFTSAIRQSKELSLLHEIRTAIARELNLNHIVKRTVEAIAETFGYTLVSLYMRDGDTLLLQHQVGYEQVIPEIPVTQGISGRVVQTGQPVLLEDVRNDRSFLGAVEGIDSEVAVPLFDEGCAVGVLNIESRQGVKLTEADLRLMLALSDQISVAIGRARLYANLSRNNERLSSLHQISIDMLNQRRLDELLQSITDHAVRIVDANASYIALAEGENLVDRAVSPGDFAYQKVAAGKDNSPAWQVFESHKVFITDDFSSLSNIRSQTQALGIKAAMLLPIMAGENCLGVLGAGRTKPGYLFSQEDINFGNLFARLAAVALDNVQLHNALRQESIRDPLTELYNRRFMEEALAKELKRADRNARPLAVVMLDLDHFKSINDTFGHDAGDEALRQLSALLKARIRGSDIACRFGGEEFTLILPDAYLADASQRMEHLRKDIKGLTIYHQGKLLTQFTGSFGVAIFPEHGTTPADLLKSADRALYRAKQTGRDRVMTA